MVKMENPNRNGMIKSFNESDVDSAKKLGWKEVGKIYNKKTKKSKGGK